LGEFSPIGRIFFNWANFRRLGKSLHWDFFKKNSLKNEVFVVVLGNNWGHRLDFLARKSFGHPGRTIEAGIA
jgi:hypothetical protein